MGAAETLFAVVDQGSSRTKGAVVDLAGGRHDEISLPVASRVAGPRIEHDPGAIADGVEDVLGRLLEGRRIDAIGLTCQRSTCLLWDRETGAPLSAALSWRDVSQGERVEALAGRAEDVARRTGLRLSPHYAAPKLAHLLESLPDGRRRAEAGEIVAGTLDAFLLRRLAGVDATEPGHAGRSLLYDLDAGDWDPGLCDLFGVPRAALPSLSPSAAPRGEHRGVPVTAVAGDQQAALVGHGGWERGVTAVHFGTGAFVLASTGETARRHPGLLSAVVASTAAVRRFQLEGSVNSAGAAVDWACERTGTPIESLADRELDPERLPLVFPAFAGAAAPWWRHDARAVVAGLTLETSTEELVGGVVAGVAMRVVDCLEALAEAEVPTATLRTSGKLTRLAGLVGLLADAGGVPVEVSGDEETGLAGIARLAATGLGVIPDPGGPPPIARRRDPAWPRERARAARERWREFVDRALRPVTGYSFRPK